MPSFAAGARWECDNREIRHSNCHGSGVGAALRKTTLSRLDRISAMRLKCAITVEPKTFNNCLSFERGLWQHQTRYFAGVPKRSVSGALQKVRYADLDTYPTLVQCKE
jgi:hypothetical protein